MQNNATEFFLLLLVPVNTALVTFSELLVRHTL